MRRLGQLFTLLPLILNLSLLPVPAAVEPKAPPPEADTPSACPAVPGTAPDVREPSGGAFLRELVVLVIGKGLDLVVDLAKTRGAEKGPRPDRPTVPPPPGRRRPSRRAAGPRTSGGRSGRARPTHRPSDRAPRAAPGRPSR